MTTGSHLSPPLFTAPEIQQRVDCLADDIARDYGPADFSVVSVLKGGFVFTADLIRALARRGVHPVVDFVTFSSYGASTVSSRNVTLEREFSLPVTGRRILLVDDILDSGLTLNAAKKLLYDRGALDVRVCVLLDKKARRGIPMTANYTGFHIDNVFVVGYGLDFDNRYRELPDLVALISDTPA